MPVSLSGEMFGTRKTPKSVSRQRPPPRRSSSLILTSLHFASGSAWHSAQPPAAPESLAASTPLTIATHAVPVHTLGDDPESFIDRTLGEVIGVALRPQAKDPASLTKARQDAVSRMAEMAKAADADEAALLGEEVGAPLLTMQRTAFDDAGRVVEVGRHAYRADRYFFETTVVDR